MRKLYVSIEINGVQTPVGSIAGNTIYDAQFTYNGDYVLKGMPAIYSGSSREMAIGTGGERDLDKLRRKHFALAAAEAGLNEKIALKRFDAMANEFEKAICTVSEKLLEAGYENVGEIKDKILINGGYGHI